MAKSGARWLIIGMFIVAAALLFGRKGSGEVRVPTDPNEVLEHVPSSSAAGKELKALEAAAREQPDDVGRASAACKKAIELARREADPRYWGRAQAALQRWWSVPRPPDEVLLLRATIRQAQHDFDAARTDLQQLKDPQALLTLATVELVTGRYASARGACEALWGQVDTLVAAVCLAQVDSLTGHARRAVEQIRAELNVNSHEPQVEWAMSVLGKVCERAGDDTCAETSYRWALQRDPDDGYTLTALADLLIATGRAAEVEGLLSSRFSDDNALLRLAIAEKKKLGRAGPYAQMLRWRYQAAAERGDAVHLREMSRFALEVEGDAPKALELAERDWVVQKEPGDAKVLLAAAVAAGRPEAARAAADFVLQNAAEEPRLVALAKQVVK